MDGDCHTVGRVVRAAPGGIPQNILLIVLLGLFLLVVLLAAALVFNWWRRKQQGKLPTPRLTEFPPPKSGISKLLCPSSAQALGVSHSSLVGVGSQELGAVFLQSFRPTWMTGQPWARLLEQCSCLCSTQALTTEMTLVRCRGARV